MNGARLAFRQVGFVALLMLALSLPFEFERPLLSVGPLAITNVELLLGAVLLAAAVALPTAEPARPPRSWLWLGLWFLIAMALSVAFAPNDRGNAAKAAFRTLSGLMLVLAVPRLAVTPGRRRAVAWALLAGGLLAATIGLVESLAGYDFGWLRLWRAEPTVAGPFLRLSGPYDYANQAAMSIEAMLPLLVAALAGALAARRWGRSAALVAGLLVCVQAAVLTFSRASFVTLALVAATMTGLLLARSAARSTRRRLAVLWGATTAAVLLAVGANWLFSSAFRMRLQSDVDTGWYRVTIEAPATLELAADETAVVPVTLTNSGTLTWRRSGTNPYNLGMRWQPAETGRELTARPRWPLPADVPPGGSVTLEVAVRAPIQGGDYRLIWDVVHENVTWFGAKTQQETATRVRVTGSAEPRPGGGQLASETTLPLRFDQPIPGRRALWGAALRLIRAHPLTGLGPDNYRLTYGETLNAVQGTDTVWNNTIHTNNWYLETLVSFGLLGGLPFLVWLGLLGTDIVRTALRPAVNAWRLAAGAGLLAFMVHGLLDYFLLFNATALLFWMLAALWSGMRDDDARI
jgi:hypothetical protein